MTVLEAMLLGSLDLHDLGVMHDELNDTKLKRFDQTLNEVQPFRWDRIIAAVALRRVHGAQIAPNR